MSITLLPLVPSSATSSPPARPSFLRSAVLARRLRSPREPGLTAVALGLLALTSAVHPVWALPSVGVAAAALVVAVAALLRPGERRLGAAGAAAAVLALAVATVTVPATLRGVGDLLGWIAGLRP